MKALILLVFTVVGVAFFTAGTSAIGRWMKADPWHAGVVVLAYLLLLFVLGLWDAEEDIANLETVTFTLVLGKPEFHPSLSVIVDTERKAVANVFIVRLAVDVRNSANKLGTADFSHIELLTRASSWRRWKASRVVYDKEIEAPMGGIEGLKWQPWVEHEVLPNKKRKIPLDFGIRDGAKYRTGQLRVRVTMDVVGQSRLTNEAPISFPSPPPATLPGSMVSG